MYGGIMFCSSCGKEIADDAVVCIGCGRSVSKNTKTREKWTTAEMIVMVITTTIFPIIGFVYGGIGLSKEEKKGQGALLLVTAILVSLVWTIAAMG
jgi:predicted nucleic acid-binding Zn ribbon protein